MNSCIEYESRAFRPRRRSGEKPGYRIAIAGLLLLWAVLSLVTALVAVALFVPGHLGLDDWLQVLAKLWPDEIPMFTT
jgi:hypothetical protein